MIIYKMNVLEELAKKGYSSTRLRREKILSEATMTKLRHGENINTTTLNALCIMLRCQPGDILEVQPSDEEKIKYF